MKKILNTLYITSPDRWLSLESENIVISEHGSDIGRVPLHNLESVVAFGSVGATPALMGKCAEDNIGLYFMSRSGKFQCSVCGEINGNVLLRREQFRIADDEKRSLEIAKLMIAGKLFNSRYSFERTLRDHALRIDTAKFEERSAYLSSLAEDTAIARVVITSPRVSLKSLSWTWRCMISPSTVRKFSAHCCSRCIKAHCLRQKTKC